MNKIISIRPSKDLRNNYAQISLLAKNNPVAITVNGKEDIVILSHEDYSANQNYISELESKLALYDHLAQSMDDIKLGRAQKFDDTIADILKELDNYEL